MGISNGKKMKYIIMADSSVDFEIPKQLSVINGEPLVKRTIRLLKENGVENILITAHDKRFDNLGAKRYEPLYNDYEPGNPKTYWLNGYPIELLNEPICFICGDVYFSENAIKTIVEAETDSTLFFCTHNNQSPFYIKHHDEPLAYKVVDYELFKKKIDETKKLKDEGMCCREPVVWELYRVINGIWVNEHKLTTNYVAINDESCDVDSKNDIKLLNKMLGGIEMIKVEALQDFTLSRFDEIENIERVRMDEKGRIFIGDKFECEKELCDYLLGANPINRPVVKVIEVIPEKIEIKEEPKQEVKTEEKITIPKKATRKRTSKK